MFTSSLRITIVFLLQLILFDYIHKSCPLLVKGLQRSHLMQHVEY